MTVGYDEDNATAIENSDGWERMARQLRGGLRVLRAEMDLTIDNPAKWIDWYDEYEDIRDTINDLLQEIAGG